jgi:signal transduction histidine kinase/CheY-like chemotaxis protein
MSTAERSQAHPLRIRGRVSYFDPLYHLLWIERDDHVGVYIQLSDDPPPMRTGEYVEIGGTYTPSRGLEGPRVTVRVIDENAPVTPLDTKGRINDAEAFTSRIVTTEAYVDSQQVIDDQHVRLAAIVGNRTVICWVRPDPAGRFPDWRHRFVRVTGLYSGRFDPSETSLLIEIWLGGPDSVRVLGSMQDTAEFNMAPTPINGLYRVAEGTVVRVRGMVAAQRVGTALTVRDATGQVEVRSVQKERLLLGTGVEAVGRVASSGSQWVIDDALYRPVGAPATGAGDAGGPAAGPLTRVAEIKALKADEAAGGRAVDVRGMVTWTDPDTDYFYLEDLTGGIRVDYDRSRIGAFPFVKYLEVKGVTRAGRVVPTVELREFTDLGSRDYPPPKPISIDEALSGRNDGEWVEMRGFVRSIDARGDWKIVNVATISGNFSGRLKSPVSPSANPGSLIRMHGVCETFPDAGAGMAEIVLRVPFLHDITVEENAPADYFDLPVRRLTDLQQASAIQGMIRVRVSGTVAFAEPGKRIYLGDGDTGMLLLGREDAALEPGDRLDAVGILGRQGARTILREAVFRRTGTGPAPEALVLAGARPVEPAADYRLVRLRGTLIDVFRNPGGTRLTLQEGGAHFDATLDGPPGAASAALAVGAGLEVTGIYQLVYDDFRHARSFQLLLRSPADITVYAPARFWTVQRSLTAASVLGGCVLLGLAWIGALRRRVRHQTAQIREQMEQRVRLESEIQRAARLESLGKLAGGIAHDYNNLLTAILGNLSLIKLSQALMGADAESVREIEKAAGRARELTRRLLTFSEGGEPLRCAADLPAIVREAAGRAVTARNVSCDFAIARDLRPTEIDSEQVVLAVQSIVRTAVRAMPDGGSVRIALANADLPVASHALPAGRYVTISIADTGESIPAEELPRIFDPFFASRRTGGDLDLAMAYSIVKKHHGHIEARSETGQGTTFTVWLPATGAGARPAPEERQAPAPGPAAGSAPARVLLMDDEESIRRVGSIVLQRMGLEPTAVADGEGALREFEAARDSGRPFSLLILDLTVPNGMGGQATIAAIRASDAQVPAIVCSGYSRDPVMANFREHGFQAVVPKPYDIAILKETIGRLLPSSRKG